jgi:dTMP kinase
MFIVLEGTDGSGKTEQFKRLIERLKAEGFETTTFDFPQYSSPSTYFVREYLNGKYGGWDEVGPYRASVFYALDRFDVGLKINKAVKEGKICVSNRYVASNMGHQGAKIKNDKELMKFLNWVNDFEYEIMGIPRPDLNIILHMPAVVAYGLVAKKGDREYLGGRRRDIHEADLNHLERAEKVYLKIAKIFPKDFWVVECVEAGRLLPMEEIHERVYEIFKTKLSHSQINKNC